MRLLLLCLDCNRRGRVLIFEASRKGHDHFDGHGAVGFEFLEFGLTKSK
jgi:hypothetical protein